MKKALTYFAIALALISCGRDLSPEDVQEIHFDLGIAVATAPGTKSTVTQDANGSAGETAMGENYIKTVDIFFYQEATQNADPNATPTHHLYRNNANTNNLWTLSDGVSEEFLKDIFGVTGNNELTSGLKCTAYAVVNYSPTSGSSFADNATRTQIRQMVKESTFNTVDSNADGIPQETFVMEGATEIQLTIQNGLKYASGTIPVYRSASKIRLEVTVPDDIVTNGVEDGNGFTWKPLSDRMKVVLVHGVKKGIICAMDDSYTYGFSGSDNYFAEANDPNLWLTYGHRLVATGDKMDSNDPSVKIGTKYEHATPMYSYPTQDWKNTPENETYLTLILPWQREDMTNEFKNTYYQIPIAVNPTDPEYRLKHNRYYRMEVEVGILGSFELEDKVQLYPSTYIVLDWSVKKEEQANTTAPVSMSQTAYLAVAAHADTLNNINSHTVDYASSHTASATITKIEYLDYSQKTIRLARITSDYPNRISYYTNYSPDGNGSYTVSGTPTNTTVNGIYNTYSVRTVENAETGATSVEFSHTIDPATMFSTVNAFVTVSNGVVEDEHIIFTQHPPIRIEAHQSNGNVFVNGTGNASSTSNVYTNANDWIGSINARDDAAGLNMSGNNTNPNVYAIYISSFSDGSSYIIGDPRVSTPDNNMGHSDNSWSGGTTTYSTTATGNPGETYGTFYVNYSSYSANTSSITREYTTNSSYSSATGNWGSYTSEQSAYGPDADGYYYWRTGRGGWSGYTYHRARYTFTGYKSTSGGLTNYYPTNATGTENMIAPAILIASSYGKTAYSNMTLERAALRCALYQEDGYPAGRWRLPTFSEVKFIMELSTADKIPTLFQMDKPDWVGYWCANGKVVADRNGNILLQTPGNYSDNSNTAPRCVYDLWYWGEDHTDYATTWHLGDND